MGYGWHYGGTLDIRLAAADTVILLDLPRLTCLRRVVRRRFQFHGRSRPDLAECCPERLDWAFLRWIWSYPKVRRPKLLKRLERLGRDRDVIILRSTAEVEQFLASVSGPAAAHTPSVMMGLRGESRARGVNHEGSR